MNDQNDDDRYKAHPLLSRPSRPQHSDVAPASRVPRPLCHQEAGPAALIATIPAAAKNQKTTAPSGEKILVSTLLHGRSDAIRCPCLRIASVHFQPDDRGGHATAAPTKPTFPSTALGGFVKDRALARVLGETLFRDTVDVMSDSSIPPAMTAPASGVSEQFRDNSAQARLPAPCWLTSHWTNTCG